jgi:hypothetical protein
VSDCAVPGAHLTYAQAFGRSRNLPVLNLARGLPVAVLTAAAGDYGLSVPNGPSVPNAVTLGMATITPRRALANALAIAEGVAGRPAIGPNVHVVARAKVNGQWIEASTKPVVDLRTYFAQAQARQLLATATGAALRTPGGTLTGAVAPDAPLGTQEIGKTGTVAGPPPGKFTVQKQALGGGIGPAHNAYVGLVAAPDQDLGVEISMIQLWRTVRSYAAKPVATPAPAPAATQEGGPV